jgi:hypothetical protein
MRRTIALWGPPEWIQLIGVFGAVVLGIALMSPARTAVLALVGALLVLALVFWLPPHLFLGASVAVLASSTAPAFEGHPTNVGSIKIYTFDLLLALVVLRAALPRERRPQQLRILDTAVALPVALWGLFMLIAGARGFSAGNSVGAIARLETSLIYFPLFCWGFMRILGEASVSIPRVIRTLTITTLAFIAYAAYARIAHQRFGAPSGSGIGAVQTTEGVLRRDYGFFSAFQVYALLALGGLSYLVFSRRATLTTILVACAGLAATLLTLVRGLIFGVVAGVIWIVVLSIKTRWHVKLFSRLFSFVVVCAIAGTLFAIFGSGAARGVTERLLPGIAVQAQGANENTQFRVHVLATGSRIARDEPLGLGFVTPEALESAGYPPLYVPHSQWATLLVYTGWPGILVLGWAGMALVRRSFQLPAAAPWLHPLLAATALLVLFQGLAWDVFFSQPWSVGMIALIVALRFGLRASDSLDSPEGQLDGQRLSSGLPTRA